MPFPSLAFLEQLTEPLITILKKYSAAINAWLQAQHKDDGSHAAITADSISVTGTVTATGTSASTFGGDVYADFGRLDQLALIRNDTASLSSSTCLGPALEIGHPTLASWGWALISNYLHLASGISGGAGRRALVFFYVPANGTANSGAMSLGQDSAGTAGVYYLTPENPTATLNIGANAAAIGAGFRVDGVYANSTVDCTGTIVSGGIATLNSVVINTLISTHGNKIQYDGANQLFIGIPGTTTSKKATFLDSGGASVATIDATGAAAFNATMQSSYVIITDGVTAPSSTGGVAKIYVDTADGDLKVIFGDGTIKTIVTDT